MTNTMMLVLPLCIFLLMPAGAMRHSTEDNPEQITVQSLLNKQMLTVQQAALVERLYLKVPGLLPALARCESLPLVAGSHFKEAEEFDEQHILNETSAEFEAELHGIQREDEDEEEEIFYDSLEYLADELESSPVSFLQRDVCELGQASRSSGIDALLLAATLTDKGILVQEEWIREIGDQALSACQVERIKHIDGLHQFLTQSDDCGDAEEAEPCVVRKDIREERALRRMTQKPELPLVSQCTCSDGNAPVGKDTLLEVIEQEGIRSTPLMMREAAAHHCESVKPGSLPTYLMKCSPSKRGYCCTEGFEGGRAIAAQQKKSLLEKSWMGIIETVNHMVEDSEQLREMMEKMVREALPKDQKAMLYKFYVVHNHHVQVFFKRHMYCNEHPEDLATCDDPVTMVWSLKKIYRHLDKAKRSIGRLMSCVRFGALPLWDSGNEYQRNGKLGVIQNVMWRSIRFFASGQLSAKITRLGVATVTAIWRHRFYILITAVICQSAVPAMAALTTSAGMIASSTSWMTALSVFTKTFALNVGCTVLSHPTIVMSMIRGLMANFILTDWFVDTIITPFWKMIVVFEPAVLLLDVAKGSVKAVTDMLKWIGKALRRNSTETSVDQRTTWLKAAREFHESTAAEFLYLALSSFLASILQIWAKLICGLLTPITTAANAVEVGVEQGAQIAGNFWDKLVRWTTQGVKTVSGDSGVEQVAAMAARDDVHREAFEGVLHKVFDNAHLMLGQVYEVTATQLHGALDSVNLALHAMGANAAFTYSMSALLGWLFRGYFQRGKVLSDAALQLTKSSAETSFNSYSCEGKKQYSSCLFLKHAGLPQEELVEGKCCYGKCQLPLARCAKLSEEDEKALAEFDVSAVSFTHVTRQSHLLSEFAEKTQKSYRGCDKD
eukprot:CAMPEP_0197641630 /NCGR_PEP_ID=MMETSP1338-20131121/15545_1 /TAXON_ID=43686 ORGANISM="Pelagodinium beii, Strain RCC1491" /NCGR_SAMPLE_ID=MMETSP1338 /ASSEMBLY_ACC=CAM_ASM_000754 /LENGTH=895 /DNA_ID=CAMNT_0043214649 /DNA_START=81 /DNA_END=2768 /DNA_ORIENTATION=-